MSLTIDQVVTATQALIRMLTECQTGNREADGELRGLADVITDAAEDRLQHGALFVLGAANRERAADLADEAAAAEALWNQHHLSRAA